MYSPNADVICECPLTLRASILPFALLLFRTIVDSVRVWHMPDVSLGRDADLLEDAGLLQTVDAHLSQLELSDFFEWWRVKDIP